MNYAPSKLVSSAVLVLAAACLCVPSPAEAQWTDPNAEQQGAAPATGARGGPLMDAPTGLSLAGLAGYTFDLEDGDFNPFAFTLGGRAGYTFDLPIYVGGTLVFYTGEANSLDDPFVGSIKTSLRMLEIGGEVGYDFLLGPVVLRPFLGLGANILMEKVKVSGESDRETETDFYLATGATVLYHLNETLFLGGELRTTNVFSSEGWDTLNGLGLLFTMGARL